MEFLEGFEVGLTRRSRRVRSWYLYEQYKALERNQLEAARQLNYKTSQDRLLYRELSEHRQRRKMCSECHSEPGIDHIRSRSSRVTMSIDDLFESLCDLHDEEDHNTDNFAKESCLWSQTISETFDNGNAGSEQKEYVCDPDAISVSHLNLDDQELLLAASVGNLADDVKEELEFVKRSIDENIQLQLDMKADVQFLEDFTKPLESSYEDKLVKFDDEVFDVELSKYVVNTEDSSDEDSFCSLRQRSMPDKIDSKCNINALWTKLVSFAYQVVQLNHGNCYYDYSSQFMTAVLACDILRRGIGRMCNVLQPYVSPIKCESSCVSTTQKSNNAVIKKERSKKTASAEVLIKPQRCFGFKHQGQHIETFCLEKINHKSSSDHDEEKCSSGKPWFQCLSEKNTPKSPTQSEAWHSVSSRSITLPSSKYSSTIWHEQASNSSEFCSCRTRVTNPMLKLAKYIDSIVQEDLDDL